MARARKTISAASDTTWLGSSYSPDTISSLILQLTASGNWDGSVTIVRRMIPLASDPSVGGAAVQPAACTITYHDETTGTDASTALSGTTLNKILTVRADRSEIGIAVTGRTTGSLIVDYDGVKG